MSSAPETTITGEQNLSNQNSLGESEEEYLRSIWGKLGVGQDGYLDQSQLALVCECIGMEKLSDEVSGSPSAINMLDVLNSFYF